MMGREMNCGVRVVVVVLAALALYGCGGDDSGGGETDDGGAGTGTGGIGTGGSGSGGVGTGTGGMTMTDTGGMTGTGGMFPMPMCDMSVPTTATCGGTACAAPSGMLAGFVCARPCCLPDDSCGSRRATMMNATDCTPPAVADPDCPPFRTMGMMGMGTMLRGCCAPSGVCGVISTADMTCITSSPLLPSLMPGGPCDGSGDGGVDADGGN